MDQKTKLFPELRRPLFYLQQGIRNVISKYLNNRRSDWEFRYGIGYREFLETSDQEARYYILSGILSEFVSKQGRKIDILDVGCGCGTLCPMIGNLVARYAGTDLSVKAIEEAKTRFPNHPQFHFSAEDFADLKESEKYDVVLFTEVFYYFPMRDIETYFSKALRMLKPGGTLLISMGEGPKAKWVWRRLLALQKPVKLLGFGGGKKSTRWRVGWFEPTVAVPQITGTQKT